MALSMRKVIRSAVVNTRLLRERWESGVAYNPLSDQATQDPYPLYARLHALVNKAFTRRTVNALEPHIRGLLGSLLDEVDDPAGFDLMKAVALDAYLRPIISARRVDPQDDIVSALAQAEEEGDRLSEREVLNMLRLLLVAGNETTTNLIGNGTLALLRHPEQLERLRQDPGMIPSAVEELLRFDSPVQTDARRVLEDCEVNGYPVSRGEEILALLGAANRDPEVFKDPDRLDIGRPANRHLSFGRGIHHCLGAPLARLEGRIVLEELLQRFSSMRLLDERPRFHDTVVLCGLKSLPISCLRT